MSKNFSLSKKRNFDREIGSATGLPTYFPTYTKAHSTALIAHIQKFKRGYYYWSDCTFIKLHWEFTELRRGCV